MLLVHPIRELIRFLPVLLGLLLAGSRSGGNEWRWNALGIGVPIALGDRAVPDHQLPHLRRARGAAAGPVQQARAVDPDRPRPHRRRQRLADPPGAGADHRPDRDRAPPPSTATTSWPSTASVCTRPARCAATCCTGPPRPRYARPPRPRTTRDWSPGSSRAGSGTRPSRPPAWSSPRPSSAPGARCSTRWACGTTSGWTRPPSEAARWSLLLVVPLLAVVAILVASVMAVLGYLVTNFGFTVTYTRSDHAWHLRRGLFTTRETSMDANRLRGVSVGEPLGLRLAAGARLSAIVTGLNREEQGSSTLVPPAPRQVSLNVATAMLGTAEPLTTPLLDHGPAAIRRRWTRAHSPSPSCSRWRWSSPSPGRPTGAAWLAIAPVLGARGPPGSAPRASTAAAASGARPAPPGPPGQRAPASAGRAPIAGVRPSRISPAMHRLDSISSASLASSARRRC